MIHAGPENGSYPDVDCSTCTALCCRRGIVTPLSDKELAFMSTDNELTMVRPPKTNRLLAIVGVNNPRPGSYRREEDCSHLTSGGNGEPAVCDIYDSPERPAACEKFNEGGYECMQLRYIYGVDPRRVFAAYVKATGQGGASSTIREDIDAMAEANRANRNQDISFA